MGEQLPYKQWVTGSSPVAPTKKIVRMNLCGNGSVVERHLAKVNVAGSNLVSRSIIIRTIFLWRYSQVVRPGSAKPLCPGSNPGGASKNTIYCVNFNPVSTRYGVDFCVFGTIWGTFWGTNWGIHQVALCIFIPLE